MSNTYFDLPHRLEAGYVNIDSDIVMDLRYTNEEYSKLQQQISELKMQYPFIEQVTEGDSEVYLTANEHGVLIHYFRLSRKMEDMERRHIYFRGQTDAAAYLKRINAI